VTAHLACGAGVVRFLRALGPAPDDPAAGLAGVPVVVDDGLDDRQWQIRDGDQVTSSGRLEWVPPEGADITVIRSPDGQWFALDNTVLAQVSEPLDPLHLVNRWYPPDPPRPSITDPGV
jgi:hypothetical protein